MGGEAFERTWHSRLGRVAIFLYCIVTIVVTNITIGGHYGVQKGEDRKHQEAPV